MAGFAFPKVLPARIFCDTLNLKMVEITGWRIDKTAGYKLKNIDSLTIEEFSDESLSELIAHNSPVFIKTYGQGGLATSSFRGASASHTKVLWNGININSPMPGQTDFSTVPVFFIDQVRINFGGASIYQYSGALGGSIDMKNQTDWNKRFGAELWQEFASFNTSKTFAGVSVGNSSFQSSTRFFYINSVNDFDFKNIAKDKFEPPVEKRKNASYSQAGVLQEISGKISKKTILSIRIWAQMNKREIPPSMLVSAAEAHEKINEDCFRTILGLQHYHKNLKLSFQSAWLYNMLNYKNEISSIDADNYINSFVNHLNFELTSVENMTISGGVNLDYFYVNSDNYDKTETRKQNSVFAGLKYNFRNVLNLNLIIRQEMLDGSFVPLIPSFGLNYKLMKNENLFAKFNISRNYHAPDMNDLYWYPGGNPDLKYEKGYSAETGFLFNRMFADRFFLDTEITGFYSDIDDWIIWQPDSVFSYWTPSNLKKVVSKGLEVSLNLTACIGKIQTKISLGYSLTSAKNKKPLSAGDLSVGKQLIYVPENTFNTTFSANYKNFILTYYFGYVGKRYTSSDNSRYMPSYALQDLGFEKVFKAGVCSISVRFKINNLFDTNYQAIAWQPMPGRNYQVSLKLKFEK